MTFAADSRIRALLVEDNPADARLLRELLTEVRRPGVELVVVDRLAPGVELARRGELELIFVDLSLPDASGAEAITRMVTAAPDTPLIVLTGLDDEETALRAMHEGAQDYLVKGRFEPDLLARSIRYAIERKRAEEAARRILRERAARAQAEDAEARALLLSEISDALGKSPDCHATLPDVARLIAGRLGQGCLIEVHDHIDELCAVAGDVVSLTATVSPTTVAIGVPGQPMGQLSLFRGSPEPLAAADAHLLAECARKIGLAIEHARLYRAREEIIGIVSHDLRDPLNVVHLGALVLQQFPLPELARAQVDKISRASARMKRLIADLLDLHRLDSSVPLSLGKLAPAELVAEAVELHRSLAAAKDVALTTAVPPGLPPLLGDRERLLQVLANLLGNAIKFTPPHGAVRVEARVQHEQVAIEVADTGPGIPEDELPRVFDRFWQARRQGRQGGVGLGLAIARRIVEAHGGTIGVHSRPGEGARFTFTVAAAAP